MTANEALVAFLTPPKWPEFAREAELRATSISTRMRLYAERGAAALGIGRSSPCSFRIG
jgi:hypothetical protein